MRRGCPVGRNNLEKAEREAENLFFLTFSEYRSQKNPVAALLDFWVFLNTTF